MIKLKYFILILIFSSLSMESAELPVVVIQNPRVVHDEAIVIGSDYDDHAVVEQIRREVQTRTRQQRFENGNARMVKTVTLFCVVGLGSMFYSLLACESDKLCKNFFMFTGVSLCVVSGITSCVFMHRHNCSRAEDQ